MRLRLPVWTLAGFAALALPALAEEGTPLQIAEATIAQIQGAYCAGTATPAGVIQDYFHRIDAFEQSGSHLNSFMYVNWLAGDQAAGLSCERACGEGEASLEMPLFGIPVILKDNINTNDMPTTAGSIALEGSIPPDDAFITRKLRKAGAIIIGKGTLTEFANFIGLGMPTGYSSQLRLQLFDRGADLATAGYGFNPYDPRPTRARARATAAPRCKPAVRAPARPSPSPQISRPWASAPRPRDPS